MLTAKNFVLLPSELCFSLQNTNDISTTKRRLSYLDQKEKKLKANYSRFLAVKKLVKEKLNSTKLFKEWRISVDEEEQSSGLQLEEPRVQANPKNGETVELNAIRACMCKPYESLKVGKD